MPDVWDFIKNTQPHHLTIADFESMKVGDIIDVVSWDGYFDEILGKYFRPNECLNPPSKFFKCLKRKITYLGDMKIDVEFLERGIYNEGFVDPGTHVVHTLDFDGTIENKCKYIIMFTGHINDNGLVTYIKDNLTIHLNTLPKTTRVGLYGPMMKWSKLEEYKDTLYWD